MSLDDHLLSARLAESAGALLLEVRDEVGWADPRALRTEGDRRSHAYLMSQLDEVRAADRVLSEEGADDSGRLGADRVWIVDPLDGTREFSEQDRDDWAVHVALWERGELSAGAVALPARDEVHATGTTQGGAPGTATTAGTVDGRPSVLVSRTRPPAEAERVAAALGADLVGMGSAGAKAMAVLRGEAVAYVHSGGQYEWDSAAPVVVCRAAGLHCSRLDGGALQYNRPDVSLPDLLICRPEVAEAALLAARA